MDVRVIFMLKILIQCGRRHRLQRVLSDFIALIISTAGPRMPMGWSVALGEGDRSTIVIKISRRILASQYARQGPAKPATNMRIFNLSADIVSCLLLKV